MSICTILSPVAVPTSFEGPFGKIVYRVKAVIDTPRFSKDYKAQRPFYLLNLLNLNEVSNIEVRTWCTLVTSLTTVTTFSISLFFFSRSVQHLVKRHHSLIAGGLSPPVSLQQPSYAVTTKKFNYLLVKTGTLMLKARSDLSGYIPGQVIRLATEIHNKSGKDTGCVLASLIQVAA